MGSDATSQQNRGKRIAPSAITLQQAATSWLDGAEADPPTVLTRSGDRYKPGVLREYRRNLHNHVLDDLGPHRLSDVRRADLQALVDRLTGQGVTGSTIRNILMPIRAIYRHAIERDEVTVNPTTNLRLPNGSKPRDRAATASEAQELLAALPQDDQALWATAFYGGLRLGELRALKWSDVDLAAGTIDVRHGWDDQAGEIAPKSRKGVRTAPVTATLRDYLTEHKARRGGTDNRYVFRSIHGRPFTPSNIRRIANRAWTAENTRRTEEHAKRRATGKPTLLQPIALHECRHTFVSLMHDAGLSLERIGDYVGHSSTYMTDRYRHLLDGHEQEAARLLDAYLARADTAALVQQLSDAEGTT